jgi:uncharacterized membrane protein YdjX (TVP38/TMEM64 family)
MSRLRIVILAAVVVALLVAAELSGLRARLSLDGIRHLSAACGGWAIVGFIALFVGAQVAHIPGMVFVAAAVLSWGRLWGFCLGLVGAILAVAASFLLVRAIGGRVETQRPSVKRLLATLEKRPIRTVLLLRTLFWLSPAVNIGLALSPVKFRDFVIGSAVGLAGPVLVVTLFVDRVVAWFMR